MTSFDLPAGAGAALFASFTQATHAQGGDWRAFCILAAPRLAAYLGARIRRVDVVELLVEEALVLAWKRRSDAPNVVERFPAWLRGCAAAVAKRWQAEHPQATLTGEFPVERCQAESDGGAALRALDAALGRLPEPQRMALEQRFRGGLDDADLAEALHVNSEQAQALVDLGLAALAGQMVRRTQSGTSSGPLPETD